MFSRIKELVKAFKEMPLKTNSKFKIKLIETRRYYIDIEPREEFKTLEKAREEAIQIAIKRNLHTLQGREKSMSWMTTMPFDDIIKDRKVINKITNPRNYEIEEVPFKNKD